jgi:hypothetical protein
MAGGCNAVHLELVPGLGYIARGVCGERLEFTVGAILRPGDMPAGACVGFTERMLRVFGPTCCPDMRMCRCADPRGTRRFVGEEQVETWDGWGGLGRRPNGLPPGGF